MNRAIKIMRVVLVTYLTGLDIHISRLEQLLHNALMNVATNLCESDEHDGRVPGLILVVDIAHFGVQEDGDHVEIPVGNCVVHGGVALKMNRISKTPHDKRKI